MTEDNRAFAVAFLYKALDDAQGAIRSLDVKAAAGIAVLGAMVGKVLEREQLAAIRSATRPGIICACVFTALVALSATLAFTTVFPMIDPAENVSFPGNLRPPFFIAKLFPSRLWRHFSSRSRYAKLAETHESYLAAVQNASPEVIESVLAAEVLKVSFIRNMKIDRLFGFAKVLAVTVLAFVLLIWLVPAPKSVVANSDSRPCPAGDVFVVGPANAVQHTPISKRHD